MKEKNVVLIATSTVDLNREYFEKNNIIFIPNIVIIDGKLIFDDYSSDVEKYFNDMKKGLLPTSSQNNEETYYGVFKSVAEKGNDFVHIEISSGITQSPYNAQRAIERIKEEYPDVNGYVIDSLSVSAGQGLILDRAVELKNENKTAEEIANTLKEEIQKCVTVFTIKSLTHLYRGGRVSKTSMVIGNALNICPIISISKEGKLTPYKKAHGFKNAIKNLVSIAEENAQDGLNYSGKFFISHSLEEGNAEYLKSLLEEKFKSTKDINIYNIHMNIGAHTGAGAVSLIFWGNERL